MANGHNYWEGTKEDLEIIQEQCYQDLITDVDYSSQKYIANTKAVSRVWQPEGETFHVMRVPDEIVAKKTLSDKMKTHNKDIKIVKFKESWHKVFVEGGA